MRGNWPLVPTMDVAVPHTRSMADLLEVLDVVVADDATARGDFWRVQPWVEIPKASEVRPESYPALAESASLQGKRFGVPRMYINADEAAGTGDQPRFGGPTGTRIHTRDSVLDLWRAARADLEAAGAEVVEVDFPVVSNYEGDRPGAPTIATRGILPDGYLDHEILELSLWSWHDFLDANGDPHLRRLADVEEDLIFPHPAGALPDRYGELDFDIRRYVWFAREHGVPDLAEIPTIAEGVRGLEETRRVDFEEWLRNLGLDAVVFPAVADVAPADMDVNPASADLGWRNGVWVANGNLVPRHLGIPTVTVPMGAMADIGMPVGLTFAGAAYDDSALLRLGAAFESLRPRRTVPGRTPPLA
jgi:amidase